MLTHLSFEAFAAVHYGYTHGEFRFGIDLPPSLGADQNMNCITIPGVSYDPLLLDLGVALRLKI